LRIENKKKAADGVVSAALRICPGAKRTSIPVPTTSPSRWFFGQWHVREARPERPTRTTTARARIRALWLRSRNRRRERFSPA